MNQNHITNILDNTPFANLTGTELNTIRAHAASCRECADAFEAAQLASLLLHERTAEAAEQTVSANPFFQTRVLAAWREQQSSVGSSNLRRLWNATGAIVASMAATTAALAVLMFAAPATNSTDQQTAVLVPYSAETVVLEQNDNNQLTNDQVISAIYDNDDEGK
ncbi:MAG TPA: hypothetical protein VE863_09725 [Pyrinomonadaceae bacterium]|jgi:hypothetical protein|nr:hypothetical protein [Pyrinomonadaceae bacterium]